MFGSAIFGTLLATYTGVLIGATAIPAWFLHHTLLPIICYTIGSFATLTVLMKNSTHNTPTYCRSSSTRCAR